ncbi:DoxX family membrane protein [Bdellovibrio bacteriovorus]
MSYYLEIICRWSFGLQMVFWGLNAIFNWVKPPTPSPRMDAFIGSCVDTQFIMPTVKFIEIVFGAFLVLGFLVPLSLIVFAPLMFVLTGLQIFLNQRPVGFLVTFFVPYLILLILHRENLLRVIH